MINIYEKDGCIMVQDQLYEKISDLSKSLKLQAFKDYRGYIKEGLSTEEVIHSLLAAEHALKENNKLKYRIKNAAFPVTKTLDTFEFSERRLPNFKKDIVMGLADCTFIDKRENVVAIGNCGTGKTHISIALGIEAISKGYTVKFRRASELVNQMSEALNEKILCKYIKALNACDLLIIDELGYLTFDLQGANLLFQIFAARYETKSIMVTSNLEFSKWVTFLGNDVHMSSALIERLLHMSTVLNMNGEGYRTINKKK